MGPAVARGANAPGGPEPATASAPLGKLSPQDFERLIAPHLGASRPEVVSGPRPGVDSAIVKIGAGRVMAVTTDPLSIVPAFGAADSARLACHLLASDLWTSGIAPAYAAIDLNLPPHLGDDALEVYWRAMSDEFARLGVAVVTGHTGRYVGCDLTIIGSGTLIGVGDEGRTVGPEWVRPFDRVIVTKDCAVETTAVVARLAPIRLSERLDPAAMERARDKVLDVTVVDDCRALLRVGVRDRGVSALHDATEGGVLGALVEMARAAGCDLRVERAKIPLSAEARAACDVLGIDPYAALSEGTLVATVRPDRVADALAGLAAEGIVAADVGEVVRGDGVVWLTEAEGGVTRWSEPPPDPYWDAYARAVREGWA